MARPLRIEIPGGFYHVMSHGNGRLWLYRNDRQRIHFLNLLGSSAFKYNIVVHAFVLMTTHFHLLIETPFPNLSQFMRKLLSDYAAYYNRWYQRRGSVFKSRYASYLIQDDSYYHVALRYIYYNPVKARVVKRPEEYRWTSLYYILHQKIAHKEIGWYNCNGLLELLGGRQGLVDLLRDEGEEPSIVYGKFIGDKEWADHILSENAERLCDETSKEREMRSGLVDPMTVVRFVASELKCDAIEITNGSNKEGRRLCLYILQKDTALDARSIAALFGLSKWAVLKAVQRMESKRKTNREKEVLRTLRRKMSNVQT
jgi:REP element-mobilizing transposase RayT